MPDINVHDHLRTEGAPAPGVYRVVGVRAESVTLLRVTDGAGRRRSTGEVVTVERSLEDFDPAPDPDAGTHPVRWLRNQLQGAVWEIRALTGL